MKNEILELTLIFALNTINHVEHLDLHKKYTVARQILKSGCSIGANVREAQNAESKADFIHKMKIAAKEAEETKYWLELCNKAENYPSNHALLNECLVIIKILNKIIGTSKRKALNSP